MSAIVDVIAREILDSRGHPTVEADGSGDFCYVRFRLLTEGGNGID